MSSGIGKTITTIFSILGALLAILVSCISILTFATGATNINDLLGGSTSAEQTPTPPTAGVRPTSTLKIDQPVGDCASTAGRYRAGTPVCMGDFVLAVDANALAVYDDRIEISFTVKSAASGNKTLAYTPGSIKISDELGNAYAPIDPCSSADLTTRKQIQFKKGGAQKFNSGGMSLPYCSGSADAWILPTYAATIPTDARFILIAFNGFGPFSGVEIVIEL